MQRVAANRNPAADKFGAGKHGFTAGDPQAGVAATTPGAEFFDAVQEEISRAIEGSGAALDPAKYDQLLTAIKQLSWGNITRRVATQTEAEAGLDDTYQMTPHRVAQAIAKLAGLPAGIPLDWAGLTPPAWAVVRDGSALSRASYASLFAALCPQRNGTLTNGVNTVTGLSTTLDMWVGMPVEGVGVPAGATVASITSSSAITLSANATASGVQSLKLFPFGYGSGGSAATFGVPDDRGLHTRAYDSGRGYEQSTLTASTTNASNVLTGIGSTRGLFVGMPVSGTGIPASTTITSITGATTATMSANATATGSAVALVVTGRQVGAEGTDAVLDHDHKLPGGSNGGSYNFNTPMYPAWGANFGGYVATGSTNQARSVLYGGGPFLSDPSGPATPARVGPENQVKRRIYLPIITLGA